MLKSLRENISIWHALYGTRAGHARRHFRLGDLLVVSGLITRRQLRSALAQQKETGYRLGRQLIADGAISAFTLTRFLFQQKANRIASLIFGAVLGSIVILASINNSAQADPVDKIMVVAKADLDYDRYIPKDSLTGYPRLFNKSETRHTDLSAFTKWSDMFKRLEKQVATGKHNSLLNEWKKELSSYTGLSFEKKVTRVNDYINKTRYVSDAKNWGKNDYWATPIEFFTRGGDCEDYAIAKMLSLKALGVPEDNMRITIVQDLEKNIPHAVLIVYSPDGHSFVLDNQVDEVRDSARVNRYKPIFSLSQAAWWQYSS